MGGPVIPAPRVWAAAGCGGTGRDLHQLGGLAGVGLVTRRIGTASSVGGPMAVIQESPSGFVHATGRHAQGIDGFLARELPWLVATGVSTVVSIRASDLAGHTELARRLAATPGVSGVELDLRHDPDLPVASTPRGAAQVLDAVVSQLPGGQHVWAKVSAAGTQMLETVSAALDHGATAVVVTGTLEAAFGDGRPAHLSGPAVHPVTLRLVGEVRRVAPDATLIASGGIVDAASARQLVDAGAHAVQVGTGLFHDPLLAARVAAEIGAS